MPKHISHTGDLTSFVRNSSHMSKKLEFCREEHSFLVLKKIGFRSIKKSIESKCGRRNSNPPPRTSNHPDAHTFVVFQVQTALQKSLRVMGSFRTRKKSWQLNWITSFGKKFLAENDNFVTATKRYWMMYWGVSPISMTNCFASVIYD